MFEDEDYAEEMELIESQERAEEHLRKVRYWMEQKAEIDDHAKKEMDRIVKWQVTETEKIANKINWHERGLQAFLWNSGAKTISLINGTLKRIKGRERVEVLDEELFLSKAPEEFVAVKRSADKKAIMAAIKDTGEIPEGVDIVTGEDSFKLALS